MNVQCTLLLSGGESVTSSQCVRFVLLRERYQAYAALTAQFLLDDAIEPPVEGMFYLDGMLLHDGIIQNSECIRQKNQWLIRFSSRSYTAVLTRNQLVPGMHLRVTLQSLMETYHLPKITYDTGMEEINYIYVRENAAMWDSVIAYNYKLCGGFPYIRLPNMLCMMPQTGTEPIELPAQILRCSVGGACGEMISRIEMANAAGEYGSFARDNPEALLRGIVRVRQTPLDKQYLYSPDDAMQFRIDLSNRRLRAESFRYDGYCGEDIEDLVQIGDRALRVSRILVTGDQNGVTTEDTFYFDPFCNRPAEE